MSFYVEVMCNVGHTDNPECLTFKGDNPQSRSKSASIMQARKNGWFVKGNFACCPACSTTETGRTALAEHNGSRYRNA